MRRTAAAKRSISARGVVSVTQTTPRLVSSGYCVPSANGPMIFSRSSSALIIFTERGNSSENSLNVGPLKTRRTPGIFSSSRLGESCLGEILQRLLAQAFFADQAEMNGGGESVERFVGADVGGGLLAANVLFARGERQHEAAIACGVRGLSGEAAGHLAHEFFACGDHADVRAAVTGRNAEGLAFHGDNVGFRGRANDAERNGFGDGGDEQSARACAVSASAGNIFQHAEKVRRLHDHGSGAGERFGFQRGAIELPGSGVANFFNFEAEIFRVGIQNLAIFGMHGARDKNVAAAGERARPSGRLR